MLRLQGGADSLTGSRDPKLGIVAIKLKLWAETLADAINGPLPDIGISGLVEYQPRTWTRNIAGDVGGYDVNATIEGHQTPDDANGVEYSLEGTTSDDPIESHPDYQDLLTIYGGTEGADGKAKWDKILPDGSDAQSFEYVVPGFESFTHSSLEVAGTTSRRNPMHGVESYLVPGLTWTRKSVTRILHEGLIRSLGTIDTPPGHPPELSGNRNWLKIRIRGTFRGNIWQIEESWLLSGPDGWVPEMYRYR
jgi:hypothetical protein